MRGPGRKKGICHLKNTRRTREERRERKAREHERVRDTISISPSKQAQREQARAVPGKERRTQRAQKTRRGPPVLISSIKDIGTPQRWRSTPLSLPSTLPVNKLQGNGEREREKNSRHCAVAIVHMLPLDDVIDSTAPKTRSVTPYEKSMRPVVDLCDHGNGRGGRCAHGPLVRPAALEMKTPLLRMTRREKMSPGTKKNARSMSIGHSIKKSNLKLFRRALEIGAE